MYRDIRNMYAGKFKFLCNKTFLNYPIIQMVIHSFSTTHSCVEDVYKSVKEKRSDLATEFLFSNDQAKETLRDICNYYLYHKVNRVLQLVDRETCRSEVPTTTDLLATIDKAYIQLLDYLRKFEGKEVRISNNQIFGSAFSYSILCFRFRVLSLVLMNLLQMYPKLISIEFVTD